MLGNILLYRMNSLRKKKQKTKKKTKTKKEKKENEGILKN